VVHAVAGAPWPYSDRCWLELASADHSRHFAPACEVCGSGRCELGRSAESVSVSNSFSGVDWELDEVPAMADPSAHGSGRQGPSCVHWGRPAAYGPPTTHGDVPYCSKPGTRQAYVPDHRHPRTEHDREILASSSRSNVRRRGVTAARAARS
jgi:hypothetical protein